MLVLLVISAKVLLNMLARGADPNTLSSRNEPAMAIANNDLKKFYLREATKIGKDADMRRYRAIGAPDLPKLRLCCIGQDIGKGLLLDAVAASLTDQQRGKPRVVLLAGPPGHGDGRRDAGALAEGRQFAQGGLWSIQRRIQLLRGLS